MGKIKIGATVWGLPGHALFGPYIAYKAGLDGIQLELGSYEFGYSLAQRDVQEQYKEEGERYNLEYPAIVLNDLMVHGYARGRDTEDGEIAYDMMDLSLDVAEEMGIPYLMLPNFGNNRLREEMHIENTVEAFRYICPKAEKRGITIMTENPLAWEKQLQILKDVGADNLKIHYDSQNMMYNWQLNQCEQLRALYPYMAAQLHVKDGDAAPGGKPLGEGNTDFFGQMDILKELGYEGWIITENYYNKPAIRDDSVRNSQTEIMMKDVALLKKLFG